MKNILNITTVLCVAFITLASCKEDAIPYYSGPNGVNLTTGQEEMSFLAYPPEVTEYTYEVNVTLMSVKENQDRTVKLELGDKTTAQAGTDFTYPQEVTIKAGEVKATVPVTVYRTRLAELQEILMVELEVKAENGFTPGINGTLELSFSAIFPNRWYSSGGYMVMFEYYFGKEPTRSKYQFVYEYIGTIDVVAYEQMWPAYYLKNDLNAAIDAYNNGKPESEWLKDDDGSNLRF